MLRPSLACVLLSGIAGCLTTPAPDMDDLPVIGKDGSGLSTHIVVCTNHLVPESPAENQLFRDYKGARGDSTPSLNWTRRLDLSGVSWDKPPSNATLISPRHVVMATHSARSPDSLIVFHDKNGRLIPHFLEDTFRLPGGGYLPDITVGLLRKPAQNLPFYRILPPREDYNELLKEAPVLLTDQERRLYVHRVRSVGNRRIAYSHHPDFSELLKKDLAGGDSGHPAFALVRGEPVLLSTHTFGGAGTGPFFSNPENYAGINEAMRQLGGGYQLSTVRF